MIVKTHSVFCDIGGPNCVGWIAQVTDSQGGTPQARREAKTAGWVSTRALGDVCPLCQFVHPVCGWCGADVLYARVVGGWMHASPETDAHDLPITPIESARTET